jgi:hypothetical protein
LFREENMAEIFTPNFGIDVIFLYFNPVLEMNPEKVARSEATIAHDRQPHEVTNIPLLAGEDIAMKIVIRILFTPVISYQCLRVPVIVPFEKKKN